MWWEIDSMIRRLPVYILIDCSGSMNGDAIEAVDQGLRNLTAKMTSDPNTCETVWFSIIIFDSAPVQLFPLCPVSNYRGLPLTPKGPSNLGKALRFLKICIEREVKNQTEQERGDWNPLVFLMTDGKPTDKWDKDIEALGKKTNFVACGVGVDVMVDNLKKMTNKIVLMKDMNKDTFNEFFDFLSSTMTTASQRSDGRSDRLLLKPKYDNIKIVLT